MKIKHIIYMFAAVAGAAAFAACDNISEDDRYIELPAVSSERVVLLEEFTGQMCVNCPKAHAVIEQLEEQYPDNLIAVSIHAGGNTNSIPEPAGLRNEDGYAYGERLKLDAFPKGVVNRTTGVVDKEKWADAIRSAIDEGSRVELEPVATLGDDGVVSILTRVMAHDFVSGHIQLWVVENDITALQRDIDKGLIQDYKHNNVFRGAVNGMDGESITLNAREETIVENSIKLKENWNAANLSIVAFVYDNKGVLQAARCKIENN